MAGLSHIIPVKTENLTARLSGNDQKALIRKLYSNSITLINNSGNIIPVKGLESKKIATVAINRSNSTIFQDRISDYAKASRFFVDPTDTSACNALLKQLPEYDLVIAGIFGTDQRPQKNFGITDELNRFLEKLVKNNHTIITWFGNPYGIQKLPSAINASGLIVTYQENTYTEDIAAQIIFGAVGAKGSLPVTINDKMPYSFGLSTHGNLRMQYGLPESTGISSVSMDHVIDSIATSGVLMKAYPGCEVMIARKGIVIFHKTYGYHTYDNRVSLLKDDIFDLASVTKVAAALPGLMLLDSEGKFSPDKTLGSYLPSFKRSNKAKLTLREMLSHQAGLTAWIPFWKEAFRKNGQFRRNSLSRNRSEKYPYEVAEGLYINKNYSKKILKEIRKSPLGEKKYVYSDLTFILVPEIISRLSGRPWTDFITDSVYRKIGAYEMTFNPYQKYPLSRIVPTEYDSLFRKQLLLGTVHDEGAAMLGGISGHAGLFSTASDLMKLMELYRRMGEYGGDTIFSKDVVQEYSSVQYPENHNRRGLVFDKPLLDNASVPETNAYPSKGASTSSFGHSGFTGTFVWVDPEYEISYVFLCNRVYPSRENNLLSQLNIRTNILQAVYDCISK
jgi:CubicO group peptidase (beta-lactamase class C family)